MTEPHYDWYLNGWKAADFVPTCLPLSPIQIAEVFWQKMSWFFIMISSPVDLPGATTLSITTFTIMTFTYIQIWENEKGGKRYGIDGISIILSLTMFKMS